MLTTIACITVTVQATSTQMVYPSGYSVRIGLQPSQLRSLAIGLGVGIPIILIALGFGFCLFCRRRRHRRAVLATATHHPPTPPPLASEMSYATTPMTSPAPAKAGVVKRKPLGSPTLETVSPIEGGRGEGDFRELAGGQGVRREVDGRELHPFPDRVGSPPVVVPGQWEADGRPVVRQERRGQHWELP